MPASTAPLVLFSSSGDDAALEQFGEDTPLKRPGQPAELASVYVELASMRSSYVTGRVHARRADAAVLKM